MRIIQEIKPRDEPRDGFANDTEREITELLDSWGIKWEYEPHFFYEDDPNRPSGDNPQGYRPDIWLPEVGVYLEVYDGKKIDANRFELANKGKRIQWLCAYTENTVLLVHLSNKPVDLKDLGQLIARAIRKSYEHRRMVYETGTICTLPARRKRPKHRRKAPSTEVA